jgi:hypothetical protein
MIAKQIRQRQTSDRPSAAKYKIKIKTRRAQTRAKGRREDYENIKSREDKF